MQITPTIDNVSSPTQSLSDARESQLDHLDAQLKQLRQDALVTQSSIRQLQIQEPTGPFAQLWSSVHAPSIPGVAVMGALMVVCTALVWRYLWRRPTNRVVAPAPHAQMAPVAQRSAWPDPAAAPAPAAPAPTIAPPPEAPSPPAPAARSDELLSSMLDPAPWHTAHPAKPSQYARRETPQTFTPETAASDLQRVRESLSRKRAERARQREHEHGHEDAIQTPASIDVELPHESDDIVPTDWPNQQAQAREAWRKAEPRAPQTEVGIDVDNPIDVLLEPDDAEDADTQGYAVKLELAQESEALELWIEARELASEVMESDSAHLRGQASALLSRIDALESALASPLTPTDDPLSVYGAVPSALISPR